MHAVTPNRRTAPRRHLLVVALTVGLAGHAVADPGLQTRDFDTIVVTATGFEQKITDAPASITVVTREELARRPYANLVDALRDIEGLDVGMESTDKNGEATISMRGLGSDYTLVLIDGVNAAGGDQPAEGEEEQRLEDGVAVEVPERGSRGGSGPGRREGREPICRRSMTSIGVAARK